MKKLSLINEAAVIELQSQIERKISITNYGSWYCVVNLKTGSRSTNGDYENADSAGVLLHMVERFIFQTYNVNIGDCSSIGLTQNDFFRECLYLRDTVIKNISGFVGKFISIYDQQSI